MKIEGVIPPISTPVENCGPALDKLVQNIEKWNEAACRGIWSWGPMESVYILLNRRNWRSSTGRERPFPQPRA